MDKSVLPFLMAPMTLADIPDVIAVEHAAYPTPPHRNYSYELTRNHIAHYFVLRSPADTIIGVAGFWLIADEAHIITIAVAPQWKGQGLGEWLLLSLIEQAQQLQADIITLEVRPSNQVALALYQKYQFQQAGRRRAYYSDNNEDAFILTTPALHSLDYQAMLTQRKATLFTRLHQIKIDKTP